MKSSVELNVNTALVREAKLLGLHKTKSDAVAAALKAYIKQRKQLKILDLFGKIHYREDYDYKALRHRKHD